MTPDLHAAHLKSTNKLNAIDIGLQLLEQNQTPSFRKVAKALGVNVTTVSRWFEDEQEFIRAIERKRQNVAWLRGVAPGSPRDD